MIAINLPRGVGKTSKLIERSAKTGKNIVVADTKRLWEVLNMSARFGLDIPAVYTIGDILSKKHYGMKSSGLMYDDIDAILMSISNIVTDAITFTETP